MLVRNEITESATDYTPDTYAQYHPYLILTNATN